MKKLFIILGAASAIAVAAPAAAQWSQGANANANVTISQRIAQLDSRLQAGIRARLINRTEERRLRSQIGELRRLERQYSYNGLTRNEHMDLQARIRDARNELRLADNNRYDRDYRYGNWDDGYYNQGGQYGQYDQRGQYYGQGGQYSGQDGPYYDQRGQYGQYYNRDGYQADRYTGQGGPYEPVYGCEQRSGIGGVIDTLTGTSHCYEVGSRVSNNLYGVPTEYRDRYRDGRDTYYRSDGRVIYAIDARTNTVVRVHPM